MDRSLELIFILKLASFSVDSSAHSPDDCDELVGAWFLVLVFSSGMQAALQVYCSSTVMRHTQVRLRLNLILLVRIFFLYRYDNVTRRALLMIIWSDVDRQVSFSSLWNCDSHLPFAALYTNLPEHKKAPYKRKMSSREVPIYNRHCYIDRHCYIACSQQTSPTPSHDVTFASWAIELALQPQHGYTYT